MSTRRKCGGLITARNIATSDGFLTGVSCFDFRITVKVLLLAVLLAMLIVLL